MDQLAGGFHRYSTDEAWLVPHFEKMLYDNASLAWLYAEASALAPGAGFDRVARATLDFVLREMTGPEGGLPLRDRRGDGRPRGRLLHLDGGGARRAPCPATRAASSARSTASRARRPSRASVTCSSSTRRSPSRRAPAGSPRPSCCAASSRAGGRSSRPGRGASARSPTTRCSPTGTAS